ncbi:MAG: protein kinase [Acidobacteria bacterium]|nr:protein kinase [Acidobacteriota bacterium]
MKVCNICGKQWFNDIKFCPIDGVVLEDSTPSDPLNALIGQVLNHTYRIEERIGEGSVGTVFKAKHLGIGDTVAIKVISPTHTEKSDSLMRFRREAKAARKLSHPNAVTVYDFNITDGGLLFMVMEYVNGVTVEKYLQENAPLRPQRALEILKPVAIVLDVAHNLGIIHRDLKPANLMICKDSSGNEQIKVLDFGTARLATVEDAESMDNVLTTLQGQVFGAPTYMSPEQALSEPVGPATDIYTLGVVLYQMLTGTVPFSGQKSYQIMMGHINDPADPPSRRDAGLPVEFDDVVLKAMAKKPEERYKTASALTDELASVISVLVTRDTQTMPKAKMAEPVIIAKKTTEMKAIEAVISNREEKTLSDEELSPIRLESPLVTSEESAYAEPLELEIDVLPSNELVVVNAKADFSQYVGQSSILDRLKAEFSSSLETQSQPIFVVGNPGTGKTVLVNLLQQWAESQGIEVSLGGFTEFIASSIEPLYIWKEMFGLSQISETKESVSRSSARLSTAMLRDQREEKKWNLFEILQKALIERIRKSPQLVIIEDLQWADSLSLEFLGYLLRNTELSRFCFIATARLEEFNRPEHFLSQWFNSQKKYFYYQTIELGNFDQATTSLLLEAVFQAIGIEQKDIETIYQITSGNPLHLIELVSLLKDKNKIVLKNNVWQVESLTKAELPKCISETTKEKLALCESSLADLLVISSAIEETINLELLEVITGKTPETLKELFIPALEALLLKEENTSQGKVLKFYHNSIRRAVYSCASLEETKRLHTSVAAAYNSLRHTKKFRVGAEFAYHNYLAGAWERAFQHGYSVVERAFHHSLFDEVIQFSRYAEDAAANLGELDKEGQENLAELKLLRLQALLRLNRYSEAERELEQIRQFMQNIEDKVLLALYHLNVITICNRNGHYLHGVEVGSAGLVLARTVGDEETIRKLIYNIAGCHAHISKLEVAITLFENLYKMSKQAGDHSLRCAALCSVGYLSHFSGNWRQARNSLTKARHLAQEYNDPYRECLAIIFSAWISEYEGNSILLHNYYQTGLKLARTYDWASYEGYLHFIAGRHQAYSLEPEIELAQELLSSSITTMQECNELTGQVIVAPTLAILNARINPSKESIESLKTICESLAQWGEKLNYCETLCFLAAIEQENQDWETSSNTYKNALELAQNIPHIDCQWRALWGLAKYYVNKKDLQNAEIHLTQALSVIDLLKKQFDSPEEIEVFLENKRPLYTLHTELFG